MAALVLISFVQDISTLVHAYFPGLYRLFPQPLDRKNTKTTREKHAKKRVFKSHLASADALEKAENPEPVVPSSFLKRIASIEVHSPISSKRSPLDRVQSLHIDEIVDTRKPTLNPRYYIEKEGFQCTEFTTVTRDGHILTLQRVSLKNDTRILPPVLLLHGLFQSSGVWITCGYSSFCFYLVRNGFDVWLGNNRGVYENHAYLNHWNYAYWDWSVDDLALFDVPSMIKLVKKETGFEKISFVGHSQGNAQMFHALSLNPAINDDLSVFVALAPAVYTGPLIDAFPVNIIMSLPARIYRTVFGVTQFLPIMTYVQKYWPAQLGMTISYHMFHFLFDWGDGNWDKSNKIHFFRFTPRPVSAKCILHWSQMGKAGMICRFREVDSLEDSAEQPDEFDLSKITCPLALYYGTKDGIIDAFRLQQQCLSSDVDLVAVEAVVGHEHLDCLWANDAEEQVWESVLTVLRTAQPKE